MYSNKHNISTLKYSSDDDVIHTHIMYMLKEMTVLFRRWGDSKETIINT